MKKKKYKLEFIKEEEKEDVFDLIPADYDDEEEVLRDGTFTTCPKCKRLARIVEGGNEYLCEFCKKRFMKNNKRGK